MMGEQVEQLQRSVTSFRRQGSSGSVWDDKFLAGLWDQTQNQSDEKQQENERDEQSDSSSGITLERSRSAGAGEGGRQHHHRTVNVAPPSIDPPSPKVSTCGLCGFFAKPSSSSGTRKFNNNNNGKVKKRR
ncbi:hypothetical protein PIB30_056632 [Stylosanthes scabra]|uniref:MAPK kinase substrate protein n=1 Tax=Stylosanthes scabra TaxID=79078 RepID=A0ABU6QIY6_9FABA|nr:hypothetical protein [Stylosanthes scabra]